MDLGAESFGRDSVIVGDASKGSLGVHGKTWSHGEAQNLAGARLATAFVEGSCDHKEIICVGLQATFLYLTKHLEAQVAKFDEQT